MDPTTAETVLEQPLLALEHVSRMYGEEVVVFALRDVSLRIMAGEFISIVGPSGSGKSTMLGLLGLLDLPSAGKVRAAASAVRWITTPQLPPVMAKNAGALHPFGVRHVATPRPASAPKMSPPFNM